MTALVSDYGLPYYTWNLIEFFEGIISNEFYLL